MLRAPSSCWKRWSFQSRLRPSLSYSPVRTLKGCEYATLAKLDDLPSPGDSLHGFNVLGKKHLPELNLTAIRLQHDQTGADYVHVARDDTNNVFSIGFKTNPPDATGVPHILEHTTLCGSEKYPVRDPFFKMLRRSLSNFMNAFTSSDHTSYPFATTNPQDFRNLLSVYVDATLHPLLNRQDFLQEGWRIGPENPLVAASKSQRLQKSDLVFKGVVYNEMKGQMSDSSYLYYTRFHEHIFPALNNSGGDPQKMTNLTYEQLKTFHQEHYHASNAKIFTYGNLSLADHAQYLDGHLSNFARRSVDQSIKDPISLKNGPLSFIQAGPMDMMLDQSRQFKTSTTWIAGDTADIVENFAMSLTSSLLLGGYGSPLYQTLIETGLGLDFSPNTGYDGSQRKALFSVGVIGVTEENVALVKEATQKTLQDVHARGFDRTKIDGILHQLELSLKHQTANFGMTMMQRIESGWFNGLNPLDLMAWEDTVNEFRQNLKQGRYLESLLDKYLLNEHNLTFTMMPTESFLEDLANDEAARLKTNIDERIIAAGSEDKAVDEYQADELTLLAEQNTAPDQDLSSLPTLHVRDISRALDRKPTRVTSLDSVDVQVRGAPTNGLVYFRGIHEIRKLPQNLRMLLPLFTQAIMRLGTKDKSMEELEDMMKLTCGGINVGYHSSTSPQNLSTPFEGLSFSTYALSSKIPAAFDLLRILLQETDFEGPGAKSKLLQLIQAEASGAADAISNEGHAYANRYAGASLTPTSRLNEQIAGLTQVQQILDLSTYNSSADLDNIVLQLQEIQRITISNSPLFRAAITCDQDLVDTAETSAHRFLKSFPSEINMSSGDHSSSDVYRPFTFISLPFQTSHAAAIMRTVPYVNQDGPALQILSELLTHRYLHHEIREKGGAYGGGASARALSGQFGFYSYRDPNPENTLKIFRNAGDFAIHKSWTSQDLQEAKLSTFQSVDAPQSVSEEGMTRFLSGVDEDMEQKRREQLLDVTVHDVKTVAQRYLVDGMKDLKIAILGKEQDWIRSAEGWHIKKMELGVAGQAET